MSASTPLPPALSAIGRPASLAETLRDYVALTRPRVLSLVLFTAPPAMAMGHDAWPDALLMAAVILGAALIGGGCGALNQWIERETDGAMERTRDRPLPTGHLTPGQALRFGIGVSAAGIGVLWAAGGWLPAAIAFVTLLHYVFVYTIWLKPRSPQNIVIGGAAGAASPLIADAAANGQIGPWSLALFAIVFLWTPPHFWAIALYRKQEYAAAGFPMMPNVVGDEATRKKMLAYAVLLVPVTLIPWLGGALGPVYAVTALIGGGCFITSILKAIRLRSRQQDRRVFATSIIYLAGIFAMMLAELVVRI